MRVQRSLLTQMTFSLLMLFSLLGIGATLLTFFVADQYQQEVNHKLNREVAAHIVSETQLMRAGQVEQAELKALFHALMVFNPSLEIYLLDQRGKILSYSAPPGKVVRNKVDLAPVQSYLSGHAGIQGDDPRNLYGSKTFSVAPIKSGEQFEGYLYVILGGEAFDSIVQTVKNSHILQVSLLLTVSGLLLAVFASIMLSAHLTRRLKKLSQAMAVFQEDPIAGLKQLPNSKKKGDEIDHLTATFTVMAEKIYTQLDKLQTTDHLRRELVANVSHDLRTPLATLQGYIETLLIKDDAFPATERKEFLQIALNHCHRLNKLVMELFELAKLDAKETQPNNEAFNLSELIQDIAQKFTPRAYHKKISISTSTSQTLPFAYADISLIERVLENLLENALRHTPTGGHINLELKTEHQRLSISVRDNGNGIPDKEVPYIFDRFYQLDKTRSPQNGSSGLGLAIVKKIMELHHSTIQVTSTPHQETTFKFFLPISSSI